MTWGAAEVTLWGGDDGDRRLSMVFPFTLRPSQPPPEDRVKTARVAALADRLLARFTSHPASTT